MQEISIFYQKKKTYKLTMHQLKVARRPLTCSKEPLIGDLEVIDKQGVYMFITFLLPPISWLIEFEKLQV